MPDIIMDIDAVRLCRLNEAVIKDGNFRPFNRDRKQPIRFS
ncbi:hypothetical protein [uncultured Sphaerochaeta sp.]|nr:hypothetical protein [uncultured Sphaerochaeta sp.]